MTKQDVEFIANTISDMLQDVDANNISTILGLANKYTEVRNFPKDKSNWTDKQLSLYLTFIEKVIDMPVMYTQSEFNDLDIIHKVQSVMGDVKDNTPMQAGAKTKGIVDKLEQQNKYRDDLKCPYCQQMVYDNRNSKKSDKSPDFTCSTNDPVVCGGHTGKWRKSWWLDNSDIPKEWGIG
tara:strand:+ start:919 stop:1458 length:540 start_codon:yes stop_codon:yes gene_type:complete